MIDDEFKFAYFVFDNKYMQHHFKRKPSKRDSRQLRFVKHRFEVASIKGYTLSFSKTYLL